MGDISPEKLSRLVGYVTKCFPNRMMKGKIIRSNQKNAQFLPSNQRLVIHLKLHALPYHPFYFFAKFI